MPPRIFLHLGPPKTGTTFIQDLLYSNARPLREQGIHVVGTQGEHHVAANELMARSSRRGTGVPQGGWERMRRMVAECDGDVVISCERYSLLDQVQARVVKDAFPDRELHLLLTLRDVAATLPSRWQEKVKNGGDVTWADFCRRVEEDPRFLRTMVRAVQPLDAWDGVVAPGRTHIVTVPPPGAPRTLLLDRFCEVVGADRSRLPTQEARRANPSMDLPGTEMVRRLNSRRRTRLSPHVQHSEVKTFLADRVLAKHAGPLKPRLTVAAFEAAQAESAAVAERIREGGYPVVGDLSDLTSAPAPAPEDHVAEVPEAAVLDAALASVAALSRRSYQRSRRVGELKARLRSSRRGLPRRVLAAARRARAGVRSRSRGA